jgi:glycosyltransferase involved in cell wall biosynthesis
LRSHKRNIAIIIPGGIGTGRNNIGVPVLEQIIRLLSVDFHITVFQLFPVNPGYRAQGFDLVEIYSRNAIIKYIRLFLFFRKAHRKKNFEVVHGFWIIPNGFFAVLFGKVFRIKSVVSVLGGDAISLPEIAYGQLRKPWYRKIAFWTLQHAHESNALTSYLAINLQKSGFHRENFKIIPWGIDTRLFTYRNEDLPHVVRFLHIGNLHPVKDQRTLLLAFHEIKKHIRTKLLIIGEGILEAQIRSLISELGLEEEVEIKGLVPYAELHEFYHQSDVLLHTSLSEGQSEVVTEAMYSGLLVCGTKVGLIHDLGHCCVAVNVGDYKALAIEVLQLIADPEKVRVMRKQAHAWASEHSIHWTVGAYKSCYKLGHD